MRTFCLGMYLFCLESSLFRLLSAEDDINCPRLEPPANGSVSFPTTGFGAVAIYECDEGFRLVGDRERRCQAISRWSGEPPVCESE